MRQFTTELKVGIFAIIAIIFLSYMTFKVGSLPLLWEKGYKLYVTFDDISGLDEKSRIKIAGVEAGIVDRILLEDGRAKLTLLINPEIKLYKNAKAFLRMTGLLGDKYIALTTGSSDQPMLEPGDTIANVIPAADIDMLANQLTSAATYISDLTNDIRDVFGETEKDSLKDSIHNLRVVMNNLKDISTENREPLNRVIAQLDDFTKSLSSDGPEIMQDIRRIAGKLEEKGPQLVDDLSLLASEFREMVQENRGSIKDGMTSFRTASESVSNIAKGIEKGEGTIGKLVKEEKLYTSLSKVSEEAEKSLDVVGRLRTFMDFHTEYQVEDAAWKGFFNLTLMPDEEKYYVLGAVTDPKGSVDKTDRIIEGVKTTEEEIRSKIEFTAQFARRFDDIALRIGLMENSFGVGSDYYFMDDRGRLKVDVWDFSAREADSDKMHAKIGIDYSLFKYVFISGGVDNLLNPGRRGVYVGGGLKFEDEDFKYLFGKTPSISLP